MDGVGSASEFSGPSGVAVDAAGNLYIADTGNNRISKGTPVPAPVIVTQPVGATSLCGSTVGLAATAVGVEPIAYQWCLGGSPVAGATGSSYSFTLTPATVGSYTVVVTNSYGAVTSVVATVSDLAPTIVSSPQNQTNAAGMTASLTVSASACSTITYQWQKNGVALSDGGNVSGSGTTNLVLSNISGADAGNYAVVASNASGNTTSAVATLTVILPPAITTQPASQNVLYGSPVNLSVAASGVALSYQWSFNGSPLPGATASALALVASSATAGAYTVVVTNLGGSVTSSVAVLGVYSLAGPPLYAWTNFAGLPGAGGASVDGLKAAARFNGLTGVAVDNTGNLYVADEQNQTIRKVTPAGAVTTLVGSPGSIGSADGSGPNALFYYPQGVAVDSAGNVYVADTWNSTIREVSPAGLVTTLAGSPGASGSADGTGNGARFNRPEAVTVDSAGNLYVADYLNDTIRKITPSGASWVVSTWRAALEPPAAPTPAATTRGSTTRRVSPWTARPMCMWPTPTTRPSAR